MAKRNKEFEEIMGEKRKNKGIAKAARDQRKSEAEARQEAHDKLTSQQKLAKLDKRLGKGIGAKKERARITTGGNHGPQESNKNSTGTETEPTN